MFGFGQAAHEMILTFWTPPGLQCWYVCNELADAVTGYQAMPRGHRSSIDELSTRAPVAAGALAAVSRVDPLETHHKPSIDA